MQLIVLIAVVLYEIVSIVGVSAIINYRKKKKGGAEEKGSFAFAGGGLPASLVGITLALTLLGSAHNWGTCQNSASMGVIGAWFGIACAVMMVVITQITGPWMRRTGAKTAGEFIAKIFGKTPGILISCINIGMGIAMTCLEIETIAVTFSALTGLSYTISAIIGGVFAVLYVLLAGMKEIAWLNLINAILMYAALIAVFICLCFTLPGDGWDTVEATMNASPETSWMTSLFGNSSLIIGFAIPTALGASLFHGMAQTGFQPVATAKSNKEVKKSLWFAAPINGLFCIIPALIGVAAFTIIAYKETGSMMMTPNMLVDLLPKPVLGLLLAGFLGVDLSSFAVMALAPATIIANDVYGLKNPKASEKKKNTLSRLLIVLFGIISVVICNFQPEPVAMVNWIFAFGVPVFVMGIIGLWWKRSTKASIITFIISWIVTCIWTTGGLQSKLAESNPAWSNMAVVYVALIVSVVFGIITSAVCEGKPGLFRKKKGVKISGVAQEVE
ncbi:MAG: sodium:solute symporter family protein [Parasporobacterium sp.]|nr:sodium:solute symporter family protein [Parasporobacterium sp.]